MDDCYALILLRDIAGSHIDPRHIKSGTPRPVNGAGWRAGVSFKKNKNKI
jgi:hypothetical protein